MLRSIHSLAKIAASSTNLGSKRNPELLSSESRLLASAAETLQNDSGSIFRVPADTSASF